MNNVTIYIKRKTFLYQKVTDHQVYNLRLWFSNPECDNQSVLTFKYNNDRDFALFKKGDVHAINISTNVGV